MNADAPEPSPEWLWQCHAGDAVHQDVVAAGASLPRPVPRRRPGDDPDLDGGLGSAVPLVPRDPTLSGGAAAHIAA